MPDATKPYEALELADGESKAFRVLRHEELTYQLVTRDHPEGKTIEGIRVHVPPADKMHFPPYWDLLPVRLTGAIRPQLQRPDVAQLRFTVTAHGVPPKKYFGLDVQRT